MKKKNVVLILIILVFSYCYHPVKIKRYPSSNTFPPANPNTVKIFHYEPSRPFIALGEIKIDPPPSMLKHEVNDILKRESAALGANGVIVTVDNVFKSKVVKNRRYRGRLVSKRRVYREKIIIGIAVRFRK